MCYNGIYKTIYALRVRVGSNKYKENVLFKNTKLLEKKI
jgi:hypothetical protein